MDCSPPGSSIQEISQARILEWIAISFSRDISDSVIKPRSPALQVDSLLGQVPAGAAATPWVLAAAGTGEPSLNFWSTLCEPEPCAGAARGGSVGFLMSGASHNRPGGRLGGSAGTVLLVGLAGQEQQLGG